MAAAVSAWLRWRRTVAVDENGRIVAELALADRRAHERSSAPRWPTGSTDSSACGGLGVTIPPIHAAELPRLSVIPNSGSPTRLVDVGAFELVSVTVDRLTLSRGPGAGLDGCGEPSGVGLELIDVGLVA